ncbi:MAG: archaeosine biosynthesis radical SAM protein RaSEA [Patescibacteria group bacterium]
MVTIERLEKLVKYLPFPLGMWLTRMVTKEKFFLLDEIYNPFSCSVEKRLLLLLPGKGCAWYKKSGGCTMCGFAKRLKEIHKKWNLTAQDLINITKIALTLTYKQPKSLWIYNGGSFLNPDEIPREVQIKIAKMVKNHPTLTSLFVESRPEFIDEKTIIPLLREISPKILEIGIGLEAVTERVRNIYIHKGTSLMEYERAVEYIKKLGGKVLTYVLLKPLGLSEKEAIEEVVKTIEYAFSVGSDEISLSCAFIQQGTVMEKFYREGKYRPPWLWSIIEVIKRTVYLGPVRIGSFEDEPPPIAIPHNCGKCDKEFLLAINHYNLNRNPEIFEKLSCTCREVWEKEK